MDSLRSPLTPDVRPSRRLRSCHDTSEASSPLPRGHIFRRAGRVDRRPLRHLKGARGPSYFHISSSSRQNHLIYRVHAGAFSARALAASASIPLSSLIGSVVASLGVDWRSTRRGTPRPCLSVMPGASISRLPSGLMLPTGFGATARVRRPTLTTLPSTTVPRSQFTLPTAPQHRRRRPNPRLQQTGTRSAPGASRRQARASS